MTLTDPMNGGSSTARVPTPDAADRARNEATQARARGNLAAILCDTWSVDPADPDWDDMALMSAADEFAELADILGLGPAVERAPGRCECGVVLPLSYVTGSGSGIYGDGQCTACTRRARAS
jgi:hypothetical protein